MSRSWHRHGAPFRLAWLAWFVDLVFPPRCAACGASADVLCPGCRASLRRLAGPCCARCGAPTAWPVERCRECSGRRLAFASARAGVAYAGPARRFVHAWKERGIRRAADIAADLVMSTVARPAADLVTAVPADGERLLTRGYHPAARLAHALADRWQLPVTDQLLLRPRGSARQTGLGLAERRRNVAGSFVAAAHELPGVVLLVDDVYTTGATAAAAATALRRAGAHTVHVVTFARAVRQG